MSRRFNTYLRGFLGLLDAKVEGRAPSEFSEALQAQLDAMPFLFAQRAELIAADTGNISLEGFHPNATGALTVPANECWYVDRYSCSVATVLPAGEEITFVPAYQARSTGLGIPTPVTLAQPAFRTAAGFQPSATAERAFMALPGDILGAWADVTVTVGGVNIALNARLIRITI